MDMKQLLERMDHSMYQVLKGAVELGKWPDGRTLSAEQKETGLQAILAFEIRAGVPEELRTGFLPPKHKPEKSDPAPDAAPLKWES